MPITQDRMLALINAALDYKSALEKQNAAIRQLHTTLELGGDIRQGLDDLILLNKPEFLLANAVQSTLTILNEKAHFSRNRGRNITAMRRARTRRGKDPDETPAPPIPPIPPNSRAESEETRILREMGVDPRAAAEMARKMEIAQQLAGEDSELDIGLGDLNAVE